MKKRHIAIKLAGTLLALVVLYVLSIGPMYYMVDRTRFPKTDEGNQEWIRRSKSLDKLYTPVWWVMDTTNPASEIIGIWMDFCTETGRRWSRGAGYFSQLNLSQ